MLVSAADFIALYLGLELMSLSLYVMAAFQRDNVRSSEAGLKYFVLGALSSGMLLYGVSLIYGFTGSTSFSVIAGVATGEVRRQPLGLIVGMVFLLVGLAFKVSAVPFHMWTPDVYEGAPTPITAYFAAAPKIAAMAILIRVLTTAFPDAFQQWQQIVIFLSIASMLLGSFAAIAQSNIKTPDGVFVDCEHRVCLGRACWWSWRWNLQRPYLSRHLHRHDPWRLCLHSRHAPRRRAGREHRRAGQAFAQTNLGMAAAFAILLFFPSLAFPRWLASLPNSMCSKWQSTPSFTPSQLSACSPVLSAPITICGSSR